MPDVRRGANGVRRDIGADGELTAIGATAKVGVEQRALELRELIVDAQRHPETGAGAQLTSSNVHAARYDGPGSD